MKNLNAWICKTPRGRWLPSTFSVSRRHCMRKLLSDADYKYGGLVPQKFKQWEDKGYSVERITVHKYERRN